MTLKLALLLPSLLPRVWHHYRNRRGASVWQASHAWRDSMPGEIFFGQAAPAALAVDAVESPAGEPTKSVDEHRGHPTQNEQAASPPIAPHIPPYPSLC